MTDKKRIVLLIACATGLAMSAFVIVERPFLGLAAIKGPPVPQHKKAWVTWWKAPNEVGGTVDLVEPRSPFPGVTIEREDCKFENDENATSLSWRFIESEGANDVYEFVLSTNDRPEITKTILFDGSRADVTDDISSGTSITIETQDPFENL